MLTLGLETSCDETSAAVVEDGVRILSNVISSQVLVHAAYGGVVPEVASRQHLATVVPVIQRALVEAGVTLAAIDGIAVTNGPGLVGPLLVGVELSKALGYALGKPVVGVNHLLGHMAAAFLEVEGRDGPPRFPHLALLVSGGHTALVRVEGTGRAKVLGQTRDDAAGEAFDKVGKMLGLGYPAGPRVDREAAAGNPKAYAFPRALRGRDDLDFSFSGLKTAVALQLARRHPDSAHVDPRHVKAPRAVDTVAPTGVALADLCASFQAAVVDVLVRKTRRAAAREQLGDVVLCGGVAANRGLRAGLTAAAAEDGFRLHVPPPVLCTDNAAMIAAAGAPRLAAGERAALDLAVDPALPFGDAA